MMIKKSVILVLLASLLLAGCTGLQTAPGGQPSPDAPESLAVDKPDPRAIQTGTSALDKLIQRGNMLRQQGNHTQAAAVLERALRLAPNRGEGFLALANVKLDQGFTQQAMQLAQKALALAGGNKSLKQAAWLLVSQIKNQQGDWRGGQEAEAKARSY